MYTQAEIISLLKKKKPELQQRYQVSELGLFGSFARGDSTSESDIDILVDFESSIDGFQFVRLAHELKDLFQSKTDVVSRGGIKPQYLSFVEKKSDTCLNAALLYCLTTWQLR